MDITEVGKTTMYEIIYCGETYLLKEIYEDNSGSTEYILFDTTGQDVSDDETGKQIIEKFLEGD